jgi:hypothetical protein
MAPRIELLKQAGFSDAEIADWATAERERMQDDGYTDDEIDADFGVTRPPKEMPEAFLARLKHGNAAQRIAGAAADYAQRYFGDEPLGFSPRHQEILRRLGWAGDILIPAAKPVDAVLRAVPAGIGGFGAGVGQTLEEAENATIGPAPQGKGKAARDFAELANIAALLSGSGRAGPAAPRSAAVPALPQAADFRNAAAAISRSAASFGTEQKLLRLWKEHGITPAEAVRDAMRDRTLAADLASDSERLPAVYAGAAKEAVKEAAKDAAKEAPKEAAQEAPGKAAPEATPGGEPAARAEGEARPVAEAGTPQPGTMAAASHEINMFDPPRLPQRPFIFDYRWATPKTDAAGRLLRDMENRPLGARFIAGRRFAGQGDVALTPAEIKQALAGLDIRLVETPALPLPPGDTAVGLYLGDLVRRKPTGDLFVKSTLKPEDQRLTIAHEFGHGLDHYSGIISDSLTPEVVAELRKVYPTLRAGPRKTPHPQPEAFGYAPESVNRELVAEGFRAYLTNPNWFKATAPRAAAAFRAAVNRHPHLKRVIQFNSPDVAALIGFGTGSDDGDR